MYDVYTLSLHDALPIYRELIYSFSVQFVISDCDNVVICMDVMNPNGQQDQNPANDHLCATLSDDFVIIGPYPNRSEEHTSELQSPCNIVCRLLLEKKNR